MRYPTYSTTPPHPDGRPGALGQQVSRLRRDRGMTQDQLAAQVGLGRSAISEIENGHRDVTVAEWVEIADTLSVDPMVMLRPGTPKVTAGDTGGQLAALSRWIDGANAHRDPEAATWGRLAKLQEESGETADELLLLAVRKHGLDSAAGRVISAFIGATGQNPRKGVTHTRDDVVKELLDVAVSALGAVEHLSGNDGSSMDRLEAFVERLVERAGIGRAAA